MADTDDVAPGWLLGRWRLQRAEEGLELLPDTVMEFREHGELVYTITVQERQAVFSLRYRLDRDRLRTVHPDGGHRAEAGVWLAGSGTLELDFGGRKAWFERERLN